MASLSESFRSQIHHFTHPREPLTDSLVGHVLPRASGGRQQVNSIGGRSPASPPPVKPVVRGFNATAFQAPDVLATTVSTPRNLNKMTPSYEDDTPASHIEANGTTKRKHSGLSRREQCRANQARYRNKQRNHQLQLEKSVEQLRQELDKLKWRRRDLTSRERISHGPWTIVAEVFHLLETSFRSPWRLANAEEMLKHADIRHSLAFLRESFVDDVSMGDLTGADALMEQLRRYSLYFGDPQIKLNRIEAVASGVMRATATLSVTVTDFTLRHVFPHLEKPAARGEEDKQQPLREKLLGARLASECSMTFLFDEQSGRAVRLRTSIDFLSSLIRLFGDLKGASNVMNRALFTQECVVGDIMGHHPSNMLSLGIAE